MKSTKNKIVISIAGFLALVATIAYAAGYQRVPEGWLKIGQSTTATKKLEFDVGNTTNDPIITGDSSNNLVISSATLRLLERPANGTNYVELVYPASMAGNTTLNIPAVTGTLVERATTDTLTNKDISSATNTYRDATASVSGAMTTATQEFTGTKTFLGNLLVAPTGATTSYENTNGGGVVSLTSPVVSLGANDNSTSGSGSVLFTDTVGGSFNQHFLAVNSSGSKIRTASIIAGSTNAAGSETGTLSFSTKPSGGTAIPALTLGSDQSASFAGSITSNNTFSGTNTFNKAITVNPAAATEGITVNGVSGQFTSRFGNGAAAGSSNGVLILAGGNSSDYALLVENRSGSDLFRVRGDGAVTITGTGGNVAHGTNIVNASCPGDADGVCVVNCSGSDALVGGGCTTSSGTFIKMFPNSSTQWKCEQATTGSNIVAYGICASY